MEHRVIGEDQLTQEMLEACLQDGRPLRAFADIDSTNREAKDWAAQGAPSGALVTAESQSAGRGRKGRSWLGDAGEAIAMSYILRPGDVPGGVQTVTLAAAVAVALAVEKLSGGQCRIKWPNDVWLEGKKLCGILTEMVSGLEGGLYLVVGIGVNVHQVSFPEEIAQIATSIQLGTGKWVHRGELIAEICHNLDRLLGEWSQRGFAAIAGYYRPRMALLGEWVTLTNVDQVLKLKLTGVSDEGALEGLDENGQPVCMISGEVTVRRI